jgi:hypothetical protein
MSLRDRIRKLGQTTAELHEETLETFLSDHPEATPIASVAARDLVTVVGEVSRSRIVPGANGSCHLDLTIKDSTGAVEIRFLGRRSIPGVHPGTRVRVKGRAMADNWAGQRLRFTNPAYDLL